MLRKATDIIGFDIDATDGSIGHVDDMLFDDEWQVRYFVVQTGPWLFGRHVLIAAAQVDEPIWESRSVPVELTKEQVRESPDIDISQPITRAHETALHEYYQWPTYWAPVGVAGSYVMPGTAAPPTTPPGGEPAEAREIKEQALRRAESDQAALQSVKHVTGHNIAATDGHIGHLDDFFVDETGWCIRYLLVDTRNLLPGRKVLISPEWVTELDWHNRDVVVNVTKEKVKGSPEFNPQKAPTREYETTLHGYYGFPLY